MKDLYVKNIENEGVVTMYTLQFTGEELSEYEKFVQRFKDSADLKRDGNGGLKKTKTYEESEELLGYVIDLQKFDSLIKSEVDSGSLIISETDIEGITEKNFEI